MVNVKICGLTRYEDAQLAADLGAWGLGFIFVEKSPRACKVEQARDICERLPAQVEKVGVFLNESADRVNQIVERVGLSIAQLHGLESPEFCREIQVPVLKAIQNFDHSDFGLLDRFGCKLLMDAPRVGDEWGGTGHESDWESARNIAKKYPLFLAGNLGADNIVRAIEAVSPLGVDLSSSVERSPGIKDPDKLRKLFSVINRYVDADSHSGNGEQ